MSAVRVWIPPQTRALMTSTSACETLPKYLVVPDTALYPLKEMSSRPKKYAKADMLAAVKQVCPDVKSGCGGVTSSGIQVGSATVAVLPSVSANWIAVTGRQKLHAAFSL